MAPNDPVIASDLAAVYLERGFASSPHHLLLALNTAQAAVELDSRLPEARFNFALALESHFLVGSARKEWNEFIRLDPDSGWADEAWIHLRQLAQADAGDLWLHEKQVFADALLAGNEASVWKFTDSFRQPARLYGESELLQHWAESETRGDKADAQAALRGARLVGDVYASLSSDQMLRDSVAAIDRATGDQASIEALSRGHRLYSRASQLYEVYRSPEAGKMFAAASAELARGGSPFYLWAAFFAAACDYQQSRYSHVLSKIAALEKNPHWSRYPNLAGRAKWLRGVILAITADPAAALKSYLAARSLFAQTGEIESQTALEGLLAEVYFLLGDDSKTLEHLYRALKGSTGLRDLRRKHQIFHAAAEVSMQAGKPNAALCFETETLRTALVARNAVQIALSYSSRAAIHSHLGHKLQAKRDLMVAREYAAQAQDESLAADILLSGAQVLGSEHREAAIAALNAALPVLRRTRYDLRLAVFYLSRGRLHASAGRSTLAKADFLAGINELERVSGSLDFNSRAAYLDRSFDLFDEVVRLEAVTGQPPYDIAFQYLERARCDALAAWVARPSRKLRALRLNDLARLLGREEVLIEYAVLPERLIVWIIERGRVRSLVLPVSEDQLRYLVSALHTANESGRGNFRAASTALYKAVVEPLAIPVSASSLIIVPDKILHQVPFAALWSPQIGRYLIEDYVIALTPSASMTLAIRRQRNSIPRREITALVVGDPAFDLSLAPYHPRLPGAEKEARAVAALYRRSDLLLGNEATKDHFLGGLGAHSIVHLAAHAEVDRQLPILSRVLLAPSRKDSGVLFARELYGRRFPRTELVVLSGCSTAAGRLSSTEGILSLARPFLAGGVPVVIGSLWRIDDRVTGTLAIEFHRRFAVSGDAASALAGAQRILLQSADSQFSDPAGWGAFEMIGATRSIAQGGR